MLPQSRLLVNVYRSFYSDENTGTGCDLAAKANGRLAPSGTPAGLCETSL